jgi:3-phenylpropionate/trans-cinnamate dioxygenase ferredoxin reductase subunit
MGTCAGGEFGNTISVIDNPVAGDAVDVLVIGGGPAGHSAADAYRRAGGHGRVLIISADDTRPYNRPPLSKDFLRGESEADDLPLESAAFYPENNIELWLGDPVEQFDVAAATAGTRSGRKIGFGHCVLATGCRPAVLPVPGADHRSVLRLRSLTDGRVLRSAVAGNAAVVVIGSGFIGCEAAVSLKMRGLDVTMLSVEQLPQLKRLGHAAAERISGWLSDAGVKLRGGVTVQRIDEGRIVRTDDGDIEADLILSAAGVIPHSTLAEAAGLAISDDRILVDERMATATPGVFAAGDVALARNGAAGRRLKVEHWGEARRMGEIAGTNAAGGDDSWTDVPGFWSEIGDRTLKYTAWGDGFDHDELIDHPGGGFTVWYWKAGRTVGVLTHRADQDYERGADLIAQAAAQDLPGNLPPIANR